MKVIFLDIDGVINSDNNYEKEYKSGRKFTHDLHLDAKCLKWLKNIVSDTCAQIVISSSWRYGDMQSIENLKLQLQNVGLDIYDKTPILNTVTRGTEIQTWLNTKSEENIIYVILDDDVDEFPEEQHFCRLIKCSPDIGLGEKEYLMAVRMLNE